MIIKVIAILVIPGFIWVINQEVRIARIEATRFTAADYQKTVEPELRAIHRDLQRKINRSEVPPPQVTDSLEELKQRLLYLERELANRPRQ